ncbi:MAG TPA: hypothetical protein VGS01_15385 [Candidatus Limnocylindria bacterium]|nr:hypothetical protein [Candidatus Limnocylindria bacterium]
MRLTFACPVGTEICKDVTVYNGLLLLFPLAVLLAFLGASPLSRFLPRRPVLGWSLAVIGAVLYVYLSTGVGWEPLWGLLIGVIGIGLARGKIAEPHAA